MFSLPAVLWLVGFLRLGLCFHPFPQQSPPPEVHLFQSFLCVCVHVPPQDSKDLRKPMKF